MLLLSFYCNYDLFSVGLIFLGICGFVTVLLYQNMFSFLLIVTVVMLCAQNGESSAGLWGLGAYYKL